MANGAKRSALVADVQRIADSLGLAPATLTFSQYRKGGGRFLSTQFKNVFGSFTSCLKDQFPHTSEADLKEQQASAARRQYLTKLQKVVGQKQSQDDVVAQAVERAVGSLKLDWRMLSPEATRAFLAERFGSRPTLKRELTVVLSDTHFGIDIDPEEVGETNVYNWQVACRRAAKVAQETCEYKLHHRHETKRLNVVCLGDLLQGIIHNLTGLDTDALAIQQCGALHILTHFLKYCVEHFEDVHFYGIPGNHDDWLHRREGGGRVTAQKHDSGLAAVFYALSLIFQGKITFHLPKTPYVMVDTIGGRLMGVHGDTCFRSVGNPGKNVNISGLTQEFETFARGELLKGHPDIKGLLIGHTHIFFQSETANGTPVVNNPSLSGVDPYATSLTVNCNRIGQVIIESTEKYAVGDIRKVDLCGAEDDGDLDLIIPPYERKLAA